MSCRVYPFSLSFFYIVIARGWREGGGGALHVKGLGMLVVSLRGENFGFWSHVGCSGPSYLAVKVSFRVAPEKIYI